MSMVYCNIYKPYISQGLHIQTLNCLGSSSLWNAYWICGSEVSVVHLHQQRFQGYYFLLLAAYLQTL